MEFSLDAQSKKARACTITTAHSTIQTPVFMPVGTLGSVKSLDMEDVLDLLGADIILANTYHTYLRPGDATIAKMGKLHGFTTYPKSFLTDSGGFQAFSLSDISKPKTDGIEFRSHIDGSKHFFTPKKVIDIQTNLGSDIMMILDDLVALPATQERIKVSIERTTSWAQESIDYFRSQQEKGICSEQNIFAIIQGGTDKAFRTKSATELCAMDYDGFAIGGLSVGELNNEMYDTVEHTVQYMPEDKPRYLMGVGTPEDLIENIERGIDMFDCVMPTRNARNGTLFTSFGRLNIKGAKFKEDPLPIDEECECLTCKRYTRAYMSHLFRGKELAYFRLATIHNLHYYLNLMREVRVAILEDKFDEYKTEFYKKRSYILMPGRLCMFDDVAFKQDIANKFGIFRDNIGVINKQYNIAPTLNIAIFTNTNTYTYAHFGLIPSWASSRSSMQINARSETVFEKSSFKEAYKQRRCLIPLNGYFEWEKDEQTKKSKAHFVVSSSGDYFVFAGIYESWYDNALNETILTCALLTTEPNEKIAKLHDRMPVILQENKWKLWLESGSSYSELNTLFTPISSDKIRYFCVGNQVNSVKNNSIECIAENLDAEPRQGTLF